MGTKYPVLFKDLSSPFSRDEVKERRESGRKYDYITARTAMNRLDEVLGPENWFDEYFPQGENSVLCKLTIRLPDGSLLTKQDAGGMAGMKDPGDDDKSGYSDAFKRACVKFGVGRYLYKDGVPDYSDTDVNGEIRENEEESGSEPQPVATGPSATRKDPRTLVELIRAGVIKCNSEYALKYAAKEVVNHYQVVNHLFKRAVDEGKINVKSTIDMLFSVKLSYVSDHYANDGAFYTWARNELNAYFQKVLHKALADAEKNREPVAEGVSR